MVVIFCALTGAFIGIIIGAILSTVSDMLYFCTCGGCGSSGGGSTGLLCVILGFVIGLIIGLIKYFYKIEKDNLEKSALFSEEELRKRKELAEKIKLKALDVNKICEKNKSADDSLVSSTYKSSLQMDKIINELTIAAELQGEVYFLSKDIIEKGGNS